MTDHTQAASRLIALVATRPQALVDQVARDFPDPITTITDDTVAAAERARTATTDHLDLLHRWLSRYAAPNRRAMTGLIAAAAETSANLGDVRTSLYSLTELLRLGCDLTPLLDPEAAPPRATGTPATSPGRWSPVSPRPRSPVMSPIRTSRSSSPCAASPTPPRPHPPREDAPDE